MVIPQKGMIMERRKIEIGERLRQEREKAGYSQEAFAERLNCCAVTVSRWDVIRQIKCGLLPQIKNNFLRYAEALQSVLFATISAHCFM